jgi:hypothetical protein
MFYVVVWMEDAAGNLATEMPAHAFTTALPTPSTNTPSLAAWIANEQNFSNNIGLFYQEISVLKPTTTPSPLGAVRHPRPPEAPLEVGKIDISARRANVSDHVIVSATLLPSGETSGVTVNFYDGDPQDGGRMFRETRVPYIAENAPHRIRAAYRAETCGTHQLFAVVNQGKNSEVVRRAPPLHVNCSSKIAPHQGHSGFERQ